MRLRIVRPVPAQLEGCDLTGLRFAATYDLAPPVSDLLIVLGYAVPVEEVLAPPPQSIAADRSSRKPRAPRRRQPRHR
jgi:hypothetical protein